MAKRKKTIVCSCNKLSQSDIKTAIREGATSVKTCMGHHGKKPKCGDCVGHIRKKVAKARAKAAKAEAAGAGTGVSPAIRLALATSAANVVADTSTQGCGPDCHCSCGSKDAKLAAESTSAAPAMAHPEAIFPGDSPWTAAAEKRDAKGKIKGKARRKAKRKAKARLKAFRKSTRKAIRKAERAAAKA